MNLHERFEQFAEDFLDFDKVENQRSTRRDIHAFLLLNELQPGKRPIVSASEHDEFFLDVDCANLADVVTDDQIRELVRCGVRCDGSYDSLCMFA